MKQIFRKLWNYSPAQMLAILKNKLVVPAVIPDVNIDFLELKRLQKIPCYTAGDTFFLGKRLDFIDASSYLSMLDEIFVKQNYDFTSPKKDPLIIDCGSNIGISIIYFKGIYPAARIIGFEPDKQAFAALEKNLKNFGLNDVEIFNLAVWSSDTTLNFQVEGSWGGKIESLPSAQTIEVKARRLKDLLNEPIDFLKIDIEGGETEVLRDCASDLVNVKNLFVEYHSDSSQPQTLNEILAIITNSGMRYHIKEAAVRKKPFINQPASGFDSQLEIYAYRIN